MSTQILNEDATPANTTGDTANMAMPANSSGAVVRRYKQFDVDSDVFRKFQVGKTRFEHWSKYLNMEDANHKSIYDYAKSRQGLIVLRNISTGALRTIRRRQS